MADPHPSFLRVMRSVLNYFALERQDFEELEIKMEALNDTYKELEVVRAKARALNKDCKGIRSRVKNRRRYLGDSEYRPGRPAHLEGSRSYAKTKTTISKSLGFIGSRTYHATKGDRQLNIRNNAARGCARPAREAYSHENADG